MFSIGDKVVYPMHGAGVIEGIEAKIIGGQSRDYYNVSLLGGNIRLSLPVSNAGNIRLRTIVSAEKATDLLRYFTELEIDSNAPWGKRFKENSEMLKTGIPERAAEVVKTLMLRDRTVGLSTGGAAAAAASDLSGFIPLPSSPAMLITLASVSGFDSKPDSIEPRSVLLSIIFILYPVKQGVSAFLAEHFHGIF